MADQFLVIGGARVKLADNGDGTFSVSTSGGGSSGLALAAAGKQTPKTATGAGDQVIAAANVNRERLIFTNNHATVNLRVTEGEVATTVYGFQLKPGGQYWAETKDAIHVCPESGNADAFGYEIVS
jgi:hypothetical protein